MNDNPEIRAKVLEWQRRHNIQDNDPALALIELLDIYYRSPSAAAANGKAPVASVDPAALSDAVRSTLQPAIERLSTQVRDLELRSATGGSSSAVSTEKLTESIQSALKPALDRMTEQAAEAAKSPAAAIDSATLSESIRANLLPTLDRVTFQLQELQKKIETTNMDESSKKIETFHDNIDYCTKKLDVVKKEADALVLKLEKVSSEIKPITRTAVIMLMLVTGVFGYVLAVILR